MDDLRLAVSRLSPRIRGEDQGEGFYHSLCRVRWVDPHPPPLPSQVEATLCAPKH